ncbi:MAG: right-handed parallel beta-helix repeat-containing protein [Alistipes sp.]|nr:right-handed parallel beta-helix repeat-containing protein [Alistipes sp.]
MKRIFTLIISFVALAISAQAQQRISVTDLGAKPDSREDTSAAFARAVEACGGRDAIIEFPQGRYDFWPDSLQSVPTAMHLRDVRNITIEGNGSEFVFHGKMRIAFVERSQNVMLRNFSTDWDRPYISQGEFVSITDEYVDLRIDPEQYPFRIENDRIRFLGEGWSYGVHDSYMNIHEKATGEIAYRTRDSHTGNIFNKSAELLSSDVVRFYGKIKPREVPVKVGQIITLYHGTYIMNGIEIGDSKDVELEDITLYHALSTGIYGHRSENITLRRVSTRPRLSKGRVFSTVADASHFTCCRGEILIDGCAHAGQGDDFMNVRGVYSRINKVESPNSVRAIRAWFIEPGDTLWAVDHATLSRREELIVKGKKQLPATEGEQEWLIEFEQAVPATAKEGNFFENKSWTPSLTVRNCRFEKRNRARGMLVTTPKPVLIENNYFNTAGTAILIEGDLDHWYESGAHTNLVIRNNVFHNCSTSGCETGDRWEWGEAPITISPSYRPSSADSPAYHRNITIEDNEFRCFDAPVLFARSVNGLYFAGNSLKSTRDYEPFLWQRSNLYLDGCRNVTVERNKIHRRFPAKLIELHHMRPSDVNCSNSELKIQLSE